MNKNSAFYTCLAAMMAANDGSDLEVWFDRIFASPVSPGVIDSTTEGPATMAAQVRDYAAEDIPLPPWMANFK